MATATARNVDDKDYAILSEIAEAHGNSISEELRLLIAEYAAKRRTEKMVAATRKLRDRVGLTLPKGTTSLDLLREDRDS